MIPAPSPNTASEWLAKAQSAHKGGQLDQALAACHRAIQIDPGLALAHLTLGRILLDQADVESAIDACRKAIDLDTDFVPAYNALASAHWKLGQIHDARSAAIKATEIASHLFPPDKAAGFFHHRLFMSHYDPAASPSSILAEHRHWDSLLVSLRHPHRFMRDPSPDRQLRIGYVSPDFTRHPVGLSLLPLLQNHDRSSFEIHCYSDVQIPDSITALFRAAVPPPNWHDIQALPRAQVVELLRSHQIDILIDMAAHTTRNRLHAFALRCAPIQISYGAYPATTGLSEMDYRITDPYLDPPGQTQAFNSEKLLHLKNCFWCYVPQIPAPDIDELPALQNGFITFGSLNNPAKHTPPTLALWAELLQRIPTARLLLLDNHTGPARNHSALRQQLADLGTNPTRILTVPLQPRHPYLATYNRIDIALDPLTYNSHTTGCDALWMGCPLITLPGPTSVSCAGASLLQNLQLPELIARSSEDYLQIARDLAADLPRLADRRRSLRRRMAQSPLCDPRTYARDVERLYRHAWTQWCAAGR